MQGLTSIRGPMASCERGVCLTPHLTTAALLLSNGASAAHSKLASAWLLSFSLKQLPVRHVGFSRLFRYGAWALSSNEFRVGTNIELDGAPWRVLEFLHVKPGKGAAFVRTKMKNYVTGNTVEKTFRAGENVDEANVVKEIKQYTYPEGDQLVFMDMVTYEELRLSKKEIGDKTRFLKEGMECSVLSWNGQVIDMELPISVKLQVIQADPGVKGNTAQGGGSKPATVETGAIVDVPLFVNVEDVIIVDTRTGSYMSRA